jgi:hypothetical protein
VQAVDRKFSPGERLAIRKALGISLGTAEQERDLERCMQALLAIAEAVSEAKSIRDFDRASAKAARKEPNEYLERVRELLSDVHTYFFYLGVWDDIALVDPQATTKEREVARTVLRNLEVFASNALSAYATHPGVKRAGAPRIRDIYLRLARETAVVICKKTGKLPTKKMLKPVAAAMWRAAFHKDPRMGGLDDICKDALSELRRTLGKNVVTGKPGIYPQ